MKEGITFHSSKARTPRSKKEVQTGVRRFGSDRCLQTPAALVSQTMHYYPSPVFSEL